MREEETTFCQELNSNRWYCAVAKMGALLLVVLVLVAATVGNFFWAERNKPDADWVPSVILAPIATVLQISILMVAISGGLALCVLFESIVRRVTGRSYFEEASEDEYVVVIDARVRNYH